MGRLERLEQRRVDPSIFVKAAMTNEGYRRIDDSESVRYAIGAMQPIDAEYTKNTFVQGERVMNQLDKKLVQDCEFEFQGSTTTDTHIRARSDIDLLMIHTDWVRLEYPQKVVFPYTGDPVAEMHKLRSDAEHVLVNAFPEAETDATGDQCIGISGGSLTREVDVVPASWFDTNEYAETKDKTFRGVEIFNKTTGRFRVNTPFLHKKNIADRDAQTLGGLRKAIRLMKTLRYDSEGRADMSSYNICGIAFNISAMDLMFGRPRELSILEACWAYCEKLKWDNALRDSIRTPNGRRTVFGGDDGATLEQLKALSTELTNLRIEIGRDSRNAYRSLIEAAVDYPVGIPA